MSEIVYDSESQLELVTKQLLEGEVLYAVYDGKGAGTGFLGLTDRRVILQDKSYVGGKIAVRSLPYSRIHAVAFVADKSMFGGFVEPATLVIETSGHAYEVELRGHDKAKHAHDVIVHFLTS